MAKYIIHYIIYACCYVDGCGGRIHLEKGVKKIIESPGYTTLRHYNNRQQCNWLFVVGSVF